MGTGIFLTRGSDEEIPPEARIFAAVMTPVEEARLHGDPISSGERMLYGVPILAGEGTLHKETIFRDEIAQSGPSWLELPLWPENWVGELGQRKGIAVADRQDRDRQDRDRQDRPGVARKVAAGAGKVAGATVWRGVQAGHTVVGAVGPLKQGLGMGQRSTKAVGMAVNRDSDQVVNGSHCAANGVAGVVNADLGAVEVRVAGGCPRVAVKGVPADRDSGRKATGQ